MRTAVNYSDLFLKIFAIKHELTQVSHYLQPRIRLVVNSINIKRLISLYALSQMWFSEEKSSIFMYKTIFFIRCIMLWNLPGGQFRKQQKANFNVHGSVRRNNILIYIQQDTILHSLFYLKTALHVSGGTIAYLQERKQPYLRHLVFVRPLLLPAATTRNM